MTELEKAEMIVRGLRNFAFSQVSSDKNWEACKTNWMRPDSVRWLEEIQIRENEKWKVVKV